MPVDLVVARKKLANKTDPLVIFPFSCVHFDSPACHRELFEQFLREIHLAPQACVVGLGDCLDAYRTTDRNTLRTALVNSEAWSTIDEQIRGKIEELAAFIKRQCPSFAAKTICLLDGNHGWSFKSGGSDIQYLAELLDVRYARETAFIRLTLEFGSTKRNVILFASHGYGTTGGSPALDLRKMEVRIEPNFEADIFLMAHSHQRGAIKVPTLGMTDQRHPRLIEKTKLLVRAGAFLKTYLQNEAPTYGEKKLYRATDLGWVRVYVYPKQDSEGLLHLKFETQY